MGNNTMRKQRDRDEKRLQKRLDKEARRAERKAAENAIFSEMEPQPIDTPEPEPPNG